jgi:ABC-2 type transport system permease protein
MSAQAEVLPSPQSLSRPSAAAELRAFWGVARKEWIIFRRYPSWVLALFIWPVIFPAVYIFTARALAGPNGGGMLIFNRATGTPDYLGYIAIGTTVWMWQNVVLWNVGFALRDEQLRGTLESNWLSPTWRYSFLLGSSMTQLVTMCLFLAVSALEFWLFFGVRYHGNLGLVLLVILAAIPSIYGLGIAFASLVVTAKEAHAFVFLVRGMVMIFCGITYPLTVLPGWMQSVARWLPQTYIIAAMRKAALGGATLPALLPDLAILMAFGVAWLLIGYVLFSVMERRARQTGAIGQY